jgi:DNA-binding response OmpR family regulator
MGKTPHSAGRFPDLDCRTMKNSDIVTAWDEAIAPLRCQTNPPYRILVVDDDSDIRRLNADVLRQSGYQVDTAEDGEAAWKTLHAASYDPDSYDLLITDHEMPRLTGMDLVKKLRAARMGLPVIMATGTLPPQELERDRWLQPAVTLLKPYTIDELLGTVRAVLHANESAFREIEPRPDWRSQPPTDDLRL